MAVLRKAGLAETVKHENRTIALSLTDKGKQVLARGNAKPAADSPTKPRVDPSSEVVTLQAINEHVKKWNWQNPDFPYELAPKKVHEGVPMGK